MKPPPAWKLAGLNWSQATTAMARTGTAVFQMTTITLLSDRNLAPARFIAVNSTIKTRATTRPVPLRSPALSPTLLIILKWMFTQPTLLT